MTTTRRRGERGTTLLEAVFALAILLLGTMGIITLNNVGLRLNDDARKVTRAAAIAQDLVDSISLWRWGDPRLAAGTHLEADLTAGGATFPGLSQQELEDAAGRFERQWTASYVDDKDGDGVFDAVRVAVEVTWQVRSGSDATRRGFTVHTIKLNLAETK